MTKRTGRATRIENPQSYLHYSFWTASTHSKHSAAMEERPWMGPSLEYRTQTHNQRNDPRFPTHICTHAANCPRSTDSRRASNATRKHAAAFQFRRLVSPTNGPGYNTATLTEDPRRRRESEEVYAHDPHINRYNSHE